MEASLVYRASSRETRDTKRNLVKISLMEKAFYNKTKIPMPRGDPKVSKDDRWGTDFGLW